MHQDRLGYSLSTCHAIHPKPPFAVHSAFAAVPATRTWRSTTYSWMWTQRSPPMQFDTPRGYDAAPSARYFRPYVLIKKMDEKRQTKRAETESCGEHTFRLCFDEFSSDRSDDFNELVDIGESCFGDDLSQDEDGFECGFTGAYDLPVMIYDVGGMMGRLNSPPPQSGCKRFDDSRICDARCFSSHDFLSGQMVLQSGKPFNLKLAKALYSRTRVIRLSFAVIRSIALLHRRHESIYVKQTRKLSTHLMNFSFMTATPLLRFVFSDVPVKLVSPFSR